MLKLFFQAKISKYGRNCVQNVGFWGKGAVNVKFWFCDPNKAHPCAKPHSLMHFASMSMVDRGAWIKFCRVVDIPDVITYANFGDDRLRGLGVADVKFCPSPLTLIVALTTLSHYRASV